MTERRPTILAAWVSISAYARTHGVHRNTVAKWVKLGVLDFWKQGKIVRVKNQPPQPSDDRATP